MAEPKRALTAAGLDSRSRALRASMLRMVAAAGRGHVGAAFSIVEILRVLFDDVLRYDPNDPHWSERDRFILSKGHGCLALYVLLAEKGFFPQEELARFCRKGSFLAGHPVHKIPGVEASTGSLGHGLSIGIGMALNARHQHSDARTFVLIGDGESDEGSIWEAALSAGKHRLSSLTVIVDYNKQQSYGATAEVLDLEPLTDKWRSFGFATREVDGHDVGALRDALHAVPFEGATPSTLICHTVKGRGASVAEGNPAWHHLNKVTADDLRILFEELSADDA